MQKEKCDCQGLMLAALTVGAVIGAIAGMAIYASAYPVFQSDKWASWVQAVGSIGALIGVYWATNRQRESAVNVLREGQLLKELAQVEVALSRIQIANNLARQAFNKIKEKKKEAGQNQISIALSVKAALEADATLRFMKIYLQNLQQAPLDQIKSGLLMIKIIEFTAYFEAVIQNIEIFQAGARNRPDFQLIVNAMPGKNEGEVVDMLYSAMLSNLILILHELDEKAKALVDIGASSPRLHA